MEEDVAKALAYQVKRELAERYFGFRKLIEEDTAKYFHLLKETKKRFEDKMAREFSRIYIMLRDKDLIDRFLKLTNFSKAFFYDENLFTSKNTIQELFKDLKVKGWTSKGRFKNLFLDIYHRLYKILEEYTEAFQELEVESEIINEEIKQFKEKFDLTEIMSFLKTFEPSPELASLGQPEFRESVSALEKELEIGRVPSPDTFLPKTGLPPSPEKIHSELARLAKESWKRHRQEAKELLESVGSS